MAIIPVEQARFRCRGCDNDFATSQEAVGHRRRPQFRSCKGAGVDVVIEGHVTDDLGRDVPGEALAGAEPQERQESPPPQASDGGAARDGRSDGAVRVTESTVAPAEDGSLRVIEPTTFEIKVAVPAALYAMYDVFKAAYGYERSFARWLVEMAVDHCGLMDIEVAAVVGRRRAADAEREAIHAS